MIIHQSKVAAAIAWAVAIFTLFTIVFSSSPSKAAQQTVELPITVDYPLLRKLLVSRAFPEDDESATLVKEAGGCIYLVISSPQVSESRGLLRLEIQVSARVATPFGNKCYTPLEWQGYLVLYQQPSISSKTWVLSFTTVGSELLGGDRQPTKITEVLWNVIKPHIWEYIAGVHIDLMPPITDVKNFILPLFPEKKRHEGELLLASMRPAAVKVSEDSLRMAVLADVNKVYNPEETQQAEILDQEVLKRTVAVWENWDGLLVYLITSLSKEMLSQEEKRILTNVLLDTRYRFVNELSDRTIKGDIVRQQFVWAWQQLAPIFRKHILLESRASQALGYLAFVASADALLVFDRLGPALGLEISSNGLVRLARMLDADPELLNYRSDINPELQKLFQFDQEGPVPSPTEKKQDSSMLDLLLQPWTPSNALAAEPLPTFQEVLQWKVPKEGVSEYLQRVEKVLATSAVSMIVKGRVPEKAVTMYRKLIPAMAWQESCFRQFVVKGDQLTYLLSYNGSSVGLMQVNERVWRGLYDQSRLRWDIRYNAAAGCEIAAHYLSKYALGGKQPEGQLDGNTLARLVYAMYNGGPAQRDKFMQRLQTKKFYDSDKLFWQKYSQVAAGEIAKVSKCLTGR